MKEDINTHSDGFVYDPQTMRFVSFFGTGVSVGTPGYYEFFYGSKQEAEIFGIIFPEEDSDNNKNEI